MAVQHELNNNRYAKVDRRKATSSQYYTNYRQLRNAENKNKSLLQGRAQQLFLHFQMVSSEDNTRNMIWTEMIILRDRWIYIRIYAHNN